MKKHKKLPENDEKNMKNEQLKHSINFDRIYFVDIKKKKMKRKE